MNRPEKDHDDERGYWLTEEGADVVILGLDGPRAVKHRLEYVQAFHAMRKKLASLPGGLLGIEFPEWNRTFMDKRDEGARITATIEQLKSELPNARGLFRKDPPT